MPLTPSRKRSIASTIDWPIGSRSSIRARSSRARRIAGVTFARSIARCDDSAPTFFAMDISLSFSTTVMSEPRCPAALRPSNASPPVSAPSPMTATTRSDERRRSRAIAKPSAAEMDVLPCPAPKGSCSLSLRLVKPATPSYCRSVLKSACRPVRSLCV